MLWGGRHSCISTLGGLLSEENQDRPSCPSRWHDTSTALRRKKGQLRPVAPWPGTVLPP